MAAKDLITTAVAKYYLGGANSNSANLTLSANEDTTLAALITSISDAIQRYCGRSFYSRTIDELYDGGHYALMLREYPIQSITWVRHNPQTVLEIKNTSASVQRATVEVLSTGLRLKSVASGVTTTTTAGLDFATYPTLAGLATQVSAVSGWTATAIGSATGDYGLWPSADLYIPPALGDGTQSMGAKNARGVTCGLSMHIDELTDYEWFPKGWLYLRSNPILSSFEQNGCDFHESPGYWRIKYTAGYTAIPESIQEACGQWVAERFWSTKRDPAKWSTSSASTSAGTTTASSAGYNTGGVPGQIPPGVKALLAPWRSSRV